MRRPCARLRMDLKSQGSSRSPQGLGLGLGDGVGSGLGPHGHLKQTRGGGFPVPAAPISGGSSPARGRRPRGRCESETLLRQKGR
jgi:hypothetical protein